MSVTSPATEPVQREETTLDELRVATGELFGAERRLRGREQGSSDLTHSQLRALMALHHADAVTAGHLAKRADLNPASVTALLDTLQDKGIIERHRTEEDRRVCMVSLTDHGRAIVDERRARWQALWADHLGPVPEEDLRAALGVIRTITRLLEDL
jgi:DNA-binding MarR family transcriptional regulator